MPCQPPGDASDQPLALIDWPLVDGSLLGSARRPATYNILRRLAAKRNAKGNQIAAARRRKAEARKEMEAEVKKLREKFEIEFGGGRRQSKGKGKVNGTKEKRAAEGRGDGGSERMEGG